MKQSVVRGAISLGGARIMINLLNAASILVLARLLSPNDFGIIAIATSVLSVIMSFTELSLQPALLQVRDATREHIDTVWTMSLIRAVLIIGFFVLAAWPLAWIYADPRMIPVFIVSGITGAFMGFFNPIICLAMKDMRFGPYTAFQICQKFVGLSFAIALAVIFRTFWSIIIGNAVGAVVASLLSYWLISYRPRFSLARVGEIWGFSIWMFFSQLCETLNWRFDQLLIGLVVPKAQLGRYAVADNLAAIPSREISIPLRNALFAGMAALHGESGRLRSPYLSAQATIAMVATPAAVGLALVAEPAVQVLLGSKWLECVPFVQFLAINYALDAINTVVQPLGMAMGKTKNLFLRQLFTFVLRIPLVVLGLVLGGLIGVAIGRVVTELLTCFITFLLVRSLLGISVRQQLVTYGITFASLVPMSLAVLIADAQLHAALALSPVSRLLALGSIGAIAYCGSVLLLWMARGRPDGAVSEILGIAGTFLPAGRSPAKSRL